MAYTGPTFAQVKTMVAAIVRRQLSATAATQTLLTDLAVNEALRTVQRAWRWRVCEGTVTADDDGAALATTAHSRMVALSARYLGSLRPYYASGSSLVAIPTSVLGKPITMEWIRENHPDPSAESETPEACCVVGEQLVIVPTPSAAIALTLDGRWYVADLAAETDRNWFTQHVPMALIQFAAGHELQALHEEEWAATYFQAGRAMLQEAIGADAEELVNRAPVVVGQEPV